MILTPLQKFTKNGEGKLIVAKGFKKLPKVQNIAQSGHTECRSRFFVGEPHLHSMKKLRSPDRHRWH